MPSNLNSEITRGRLVPGRLSSVDASRKFSRRALVSQFEAQIRKIETVPAPFLGYIPDINPELLPFGRACRDVAGLVARSPFEPGAVGEVLMPDFGWKIVDDTTRVPANNASLDAASGLGIAMLGQLARANNLGARTGDFDITPLAITAGDGATAGSLQLWRLDPDNNAQWIVVGFDNSGAALTAPDGGVEKLFDWAILQSGAANTRGYQGGINQPVIVMTNDDDPVMVFPCEDVGGAGENLFSYLTADVSLEPFKARSVANLNDSLYFLNTEEAGTRYQQRLRRTKKFSADPGFNAGEVGSTAIDLRDFERDGLRLLPIANNQMVAYFEDGAAFIRETGNPTAPMLRQVLPTDRGLVSTHSVCRVGGNRHFGIFTDGWWFLDSSGRWSEAGVVPIEGALFHKWRDTFYDILDVPNRHRLVCEYFPRSQNIYITVPLANDVRETWIYDLKSDRVWKDEYEATMWGRYDVQLQTATLWDSASIAGETWDTIGGSWESYAAKFGFEALIHGDTAGLVFQHDPNLISQNGVNPAWRYHSQIHSLGSPRTLKTGDRLLLEYINVGGPGVTLTLITDPGGQTESYTVPLNEGSANNITTASQHFRLTDQHLGFRASGTAPTVMRTFELQYFDKGVDKR